ncbi:hypothetical protein [Blastococcus sp. SYSU DS0541]
MTTGDRGLEGRKSPVGADYIANLDAVTKDLVDIEALASAALRDDPIDPTAVARLAAAPTALTYDALTEYNAERRRAEAWGEAETADILDPIALAQLDGWQQAQRLPWERSDLVVVGVAGLVGALANLFDTQIDATVLDGLSYLKESDLLQQWEKDAARLPIDHTGPNFGGPAHRVRSAGHDIGRFFTALNQIRTGTFEGIRWEDGRRIVEQVTTTPSGLPFAQASEPHLAVALLLKHWAADFVTPMSLPLPGWSLLYEMPNRDLRKFAHDAYAGSNSGDGLNLRSGLLSPGLGMVATEVIVRTHTHLAAYRESGSPRLGKPAAAKRNEMLLAAHAAAGAVSLSKTAAVAVAGEGVMAVRHLNLPVLMRVGMLALKVRSDAAFRAAAGAPSWGELLEDDAATWTLPEAVTIAELLADAGPATIAPG